jgi:hypothetical protein
MERWKEAVVAYFKILSQLSLKEVKKVLSPRVVKIKIYRTIILPIALYGCET